MDNKLQSTIRLVKTAGDKVLEFHDKQIKIYEKEDKSPVTEADLVSNQILLSGLRKYNHGFLSEETEDNASRFKKEKVWIIDPLDGTVDYLKKTGQFSIMVALVYRSEPIFGIVYGPAQGKLYFAEKGNGAYLEESGKPPKKLSVSKISKLSGSKFAVSRHHLISSEKSFLKKNRIKIIVMGSIGLKFGLIAEGKADAYINFSDKTAQWDTAAPELILEEAGGRVTDFNGNKFTYDRVEIMNLNGVVASNGKIHDQVIRKANDLL